MRNPPAANWPCSRCGGSGELPQHRRVANGICFQCGGRGAQRNPSYIPPKDVADEARRGLNLRASMPPSRRGGTAVGVRRAVQLANRQPVSESTVKRMRSYFARHAVDAKGEGWRRDSKGWQAWELWGSDAGRDWAARLPVRNPYKDKILLPSGNIQYVYSEKDIALRHAKKAQKIEQIRENEAGLREAIERDVAAGDPVALAVGLILETYERPGNDESASNNHYGVTGWQCRHLRVKGNTATIDYIGKSGVRQHKTVTNPLLVRALAARLRQCRSKSEELVQASASQVNRYLHEYGVSAKDLRTFGANREMQRELTSVRRAGPRLNTLRPRDVGRTLKAEFAAVLGVVAGKMGHTVAVLRKQYLAQGLEDGYLQDGSILKTFW